MINLLVVVAFSLVVAWNTESRHIDWQLFRFVLMLSACVALGGIIALVCVCIGLYAYSKKVDTLNTNR